jgi:hypothetical protein
VRCPVTVVTTARCRRKRDFLGYYKALGINLEDAGEGEPASLFDGQQLLA